MNNKPVVPKDGLFNLNTNKSVNTNVNNDVDNVNKNVNIVINIKEDDYLNVPVRQTYYLKPSTIRKIKKLSKRAEMGVSEFLQVVLDSVIDNIDIK